MPLMTSRLKWPLLVALISRARSLIHVKALPGLDVIGTDRTSYTSYLKHVQECDPAETQLSAYFLHAPNAHHATLRHKAAGAHLMLV